MALALRTINYKSLWALEPSVDESWLQAGELRADAMVDLETKSNRLSIYVVDDPSDAALRRILGALAAGRDHLDKLDYITFDASLLAELKLKVDPTPGITLDSAVNVLHRDIIHLTATRIAAFGNALQASGDIRRRTKPDVREILRASLDAGFIDPAKLKDSVRRSFQPPA